MIYVISIISVLVVIASNIYLKSNYNKYCDEDVSSKYNGYLTARKILDSNGLSDVKIDKIEGKLTDNFNPKTNTISLSEDIYNSSSIASVSVAAHECGHVLQHKNNYIFIKIRSILVPVTNIATSIGYVILVISYVLSLFNLFMVALVLISLSVVFQLITLPTEFDASKRGRNELLKLGIINSEELNGTKTMLNSAALTYVAGLISSLLEILRLVLQFKNKD